MLLRYMSRVIVVHAQEVTRDGTRNRAFFDILVINRTIKYVSIFFVTN